MFRVVITFPLNFRIIHPSFGKTLSLSVVNRTNLLLFASSLICSHIVKIHLELFILLQLVHREYKK